MNRIPTVLAVALLALSATACAVAPPPRGGGAAKVLVCHKGKTLEIGAPALDAHLRHGDYRGACR